MGYHWSLSRASKDVENVSAAIVLDDRQNGLNSLGRSLFPMPLIFAYINRWMQYLQYLQVRWEPFHCL